MVVFGPDFEHGPRFPLARSLTAATALDPSARIQAALVGALASLAENP